MPCSRGGSGLVFPQHGGFAPLLTEIFSARPDDDKQPADNEDRDSGDDCQHEAPSRAPARAPASTDAAPPVTVGLGAPTVGPLAATGERSAVRASASAPKVSESIMTASKSVLAMTCCVRVPFISGYSQEDRVLLNGSGEPCLIRNDLNWHI